jgi:hypothetical protein
VAEIGQQKSVPSTPWGKSKKSVVFLRGQVQLRIAQSSGMPRRTGGRDAIGNGNDEQVPFRQRVTCSVADAETASGISRSQLYLEMKAGRLQFVKRGTRRLISVPSLLRLLGA